MELTFKAETSDYVTSREKAQAHIKEFFSLLDGRYCEIRGILTVSFTDFGSPSCTSQTDENKAP